MNRFDILLKVFPEAVEGFVDHHDAIITSLPDLKAKHKSNFIVLNNADPVVPVSGAFDPNPSEQFILKDLINNTWEHERREAFGPGDYIVERFEKFSLHDFAKAIDVTIETAMGIVENRLMNYKIAVKLGYYFGYSPKWWIMRYAELEQSRLPKRFEEMVELLKTVTPNNR